MRAHTFKRAYTKKTSSVQPETAQQVRCKFGDWNISFSAKIHPIVWGYQFVIQPDPRGKSPLSWRRSTYRVMLCHRDEGTGEKVSWQVGSRFERTSVPREHSQHVDASWKLPGRRSFAPSVPDLRASHRWALPHLLLFSSSVTWDAAWHRSACWTGSGNYYLELEIPDASPHGHKTWNSPTSFHFHVDQSRR